MKKQTLITSFLLLAALLLIGCSEMHHQKGNKAFDRLSYYKAIRHYEKYLAKNQNADAQIKLAESYRLVNNYQKAEEAYKKVVEQKDAPPIYHFYLGRMLMANGKYKEAEKELLIYSKADPANNLAKSLCKSCNKIETLRRDSSLYSISKLDIPGVESAFGPAIYNDGLVFTASPASTMRSDKDPWTGSSFFNLYYSEKSDTGWKEPGVLKGDLNMNYHEGAAVFTKDNKTVYFTRSNYLKNKLKKNTKDESNLKIFRAEFINGKWTNLYELPFNSDDYSVGHPALSKDEKTLFFISDMPGSLGGTDLYFCNIEGGNFSHPKNMGAVINTPGNEMFPYYNPDEEVLYFSSEGHMNMGGLDIFKTKFDGKNWSEPENMEYPVNTSKDDFAFIYQPDKRSGYFSSNRNQTDQIYRFVKNDPTYILSGTVTIKGKKVPISEVAIKPKGNISSAPVFTDKSGKYKMALKPNATYEIIAAKDGYFASKSFTLSTQGKKYSENFTHDFELEEIIIDKPIVLDNILYDLNKWEIKPTAELDNFITKLKENPGLVIELSSHTDSRGSDKYNLNLSQKRAKAAIDYIISQGVAASRIVSKGYGETRLLNQCADKVNCDEKSHEINRRTEFKVLKINKEQITKTN